MSKQQLLHTSLIPFKRNNQKVITMRKQIIIFNIRLMYADLTHRSIEFV